MLNVIKLRHLYKKTQLEMAELLDLPRPLYNAFEQGRFKLSDEKIEILCHYFNVTEEYLCAEGE